MGEASARPSAVSPAKSPCVAFTFANTGSRQQNEEGEGKVVPGSRQQNEEGEGKVVPGVGKTKATKGDFLAYSCPFCRNPRARTHGKFVRARECHAKGAYWSKK